MTHINGQAMSVTGMRVRNFCFILLAIGLFMLKRHYSGPFQTSIHSYAGNICVSFALYFNFLNLYVPHRLNRLLAASLALACVESFELFDGFGLMANTYDHFDLLANAIGVGFAYSLDKILCYRRS
jgi:short subunit fatty acids transporter